MATTICAFANADGVDFEMAKLNELLRAPLDYCSPTVEIKTEYVPCVDMKEQENHVLVMHIPAGPEVHVNNADIVKN